MTSASILSVCRWSVLSLGAMNALNAINGDDVS
jgi:hypothetical protein